MPSSARRPFALTAVTIGLLCVLTGCIRIDYALKVNPDDTLSGDLLFAMDRDVLTADGKSEREVLEGFQDDADQANDELPGVTRVQPYQKGDYLGQRVYFQDVPFDEFSDAQESMDGQLRHIGDEYRFDATVEPAESSSDMEELDEAVTASMRIRLSMTFPSEVLETNGRIVDERTAVWRLDPDRDNRLHAVASDAPPRDFLDSPITGGDSASGQTAEAGSGPPDWLWLGLAGILLAAVIGGIVAGLLDRRRA